MRKFKWMVQFEVDEIWVADGFQMTDQRALNMLAHDLDYANMDTELHARVVAGPELLDVAKAQGYKNDQTVGKTHVAGLLEHDDDNPLEGIRRVLMHAYRQIDSVAFYFKRG